MAKTVPNEIFVNVVEQDLWAQVEVKIGEGKGSRWVRFSPKQARKLAVNLLLRSNEAEEVRSAKEGQ